LLHKGAGIAAALIAFVVAKFAWGQLVIPLISASIIAIILYKIAKINDDFLNYAVIAQGAHGIWFLVGISFLRSTDPLLIGALVFLLGMVGLLLWLRAKWTVIVLLIYQLVSIGINLSALAATTFASVQSQALTVHIGLRAAAVISLILMLAYWRQRTTEVSPGRIDARSGSTSIG
jgi:hypothetical protein